LVAIKRQVRTQLPEKSDPCSTKKEPEKAESSREAMAFVRNVVMHAPNKRSTKTSNPGTTGLYARSGGGKGEGKVLAVKFSGRRGLT